MQSKSDFFDGLLFNMKKFELDKEREFLREYAAKQNISPKKNTEKNDENEIEIEMEILHG